MTRLHIILITMGIALIITPPFVMAMRVDTQDTILFMRMTMLLSIL